MRSQSPFFFHNWLCGNKYNFRYDIEKNNIVPFFHPICTCLHKRSQLHTRIYIILLTRSLIWDVFVILEYFVYIALQQHLWRRRPDDDDDVQIIWMCVIDQIYYFPCHAIQKKYLQKDAVQNAATCYALKF